jgi:uncharacterized membrane protein YhaH (DUF805 family)
MEWMLMPLRRYADFSGRSRRMEYWMFAVFQWLVWMALYLVMIALVGGGAMMAGFNPQNPAAGLAAMGGSMALVGIVFFVVWLGLLIPAISVGVRRMHDTNRSGWWIIAPLAGYVLILASAVARSGVLAMLGSLATVGLAIAVLVFLFLDGTPGPNRYGPDPKLRGTAEVFR